MYERNRTPSGEAASGELSPARNGVARERVSEIQRARMLAAMVEEVAKRGAANVTVAHVVARSGVSRRTFYEIFEDREDCFLAALDEGIARIAPGVARAYEGAGGPPRRWRERMRVGLVALLSELDAEPGVARLLVVESLGAGTRAVERRSRAVAVLTAAVDEGRVEARAGPGVSDPPALTAEGVVGAVLAILHGRLLADSPARLLELVNPLMSTIVLPYLGPAAARRELARPVPEPRRIASRGVSHPLQGLGMRLTYRTLRVLGALAANPGASNRVVGECAGIADQGQISKLLTRLHGLGLVENRGVGLAHGANAWVLTERGREVHDVLGAGASAA